MPITPHLTPLLLGIPNQDTAQKLTNKTVFVNSYKKQIQVE